MITSRFSSPHPEREHPYGHQKFEAVGALGISAFLGIACFEIIQGAVEKIINGGKPVKINSSELWILLLVLGVNIFVAFYERRVGRRVKSNILIADATHTMSDIWVTITVIIGLIGVWLGRQVFIEMHLIVEANDVETSHRITEQVENLLEERFSPARIMIHIEPPSYLSNQISY